MDIPYLLLCYHIFVCLFTYFFNLHFLLCLFASGAFEICHICQDGSLLKVTMHIKLLTAWEELSIKCELTNILLLLG